MIVGIGIIIVGVMFFAFDEAERTPTVYPEIDGTVIDVIDSWGVRYVIVELDNGDRTKDNCKTCVIDDRVTVKFFPSGIPLSVKILETDK